MKLSNLLLGCLVLFGTTAFASTAGAQQSTELFLEGYKVQPKVNTSGSGKLTASFHNNSLTIKGSFEYLSSAYSGAYIMLTVRGGAGNQIFSLTANLNDDRKGGKFHPEENSFKLSDTQIKLLKDGQFYVLLSTHEHQGGELRANIKEIK